MDDLVAEFLIETNESIDELDADIITLEQNPNDADLLGKIFRLMHTIKGTCGFLSLPRLEKVAHHAENVLGRFRDGDLEVTPDYVTLILESIDRIKMIVGEIETTGAEPEGDNMDLIKKLDIVYEGRDQEGGGDDAADGDDGGGEKDIDVQIGAESGLSQDELDALEKAFAEADGPDLGTPAAAETSEEPATAEDSAPEPAPEPAPKAETPPPAAAPPKEVTAPAQTLRVNVDTLENLMTMVSELVLTRNQLLQILRAQGETDFAGPLQRLNHVVSELQEGVMKTRMHRLGMRGANYRESFVIWRWNWIRKLIWK